MFEKYIGIDAVIHFAAFKAVGESVENPLNYYRNNLVSLINILQLMPIHKVENIVFSSSCTVYGQPDILPVTENAPIKQAMSPYGNTKQIGEEIIHDTIYSNPCYQSIILRYFNPVGAHESAQIGELPNGVPNNLLPFITQTAIGLRKQLSVFGNDYNTPDGSCIRDYIHLGDLVSAHILALEALSERDKMVYNLGSGTGYSVREVIDTASEVSGKNIPVRELERRPGDSARLVASSEKVRRELGWQPQHDSIKDIISSAWEWHTSHPHGYE